MSEPDVAPGRSLMDNFVRSCAFIHDDWLPEGGLPDWGQYFNNPFILGAEVCVSGNLSGFGEPYIEYLRSLDSFPKHVIVPHMQSNDLVSSLLDDAEALAELKALVADKQLDISAFYNRVGGGLDRLQQILTSDEHTPAIYPPQQPFLDANKKLALSRHATAAGVPYPEFAACESLEDVKHFFSQHAESGIILKQNHRNILRIKSVSAVDEAADNLHFPLLAEAEYPFTLTPIVNMIMWQGQAEPLFTINQLINEHWHHRGNETLKNLPATQEYVMIQYTRRIAEQMDGFIGPIGLDYIITPDDKILLVDINPRFCSSTYPFYFLERMGYDLREVYSRFRLVQCSLNTLTELFSDPDFVPLQPPTADGIFMYDPVIYDHTEKPVNYFCHVLVAETPDRLDALDSVVDRLIAKYA